MNCSTQQIFKALLLLGSVTVLGACAPRGNTSGSENSASRVIAPTAVNKPIAYCNQSESSEIAAKLKFYEDITRTIRMEYVQVRLTALPANFKSDASYIGLWKWLAVSGGVTSLDNTPLNFMLINAKTGLAITDWRTTVRWSDVKTAASGMGYSDAASFFNNVTILVDLRDPNGDYDVLKITNYNVSDNKPAGEVNALLPVFHADPADYAVEADGTARAKVLQALHPFKSKLGQGFTATQFAAMANSLCF